MKKLRTISSAFCFFSICHAALAQVLPSGTVPPSNSQNLAATLSTASISTQRIYLTVGAENVSLPQGNILPPPSSSITTITDSYQRSVRAFGAVTAIAPPTMTVLNSHPTDPDISIELSPEQALKLLAATLSNTQWQALISEGGLGLSDLTDEDQRRWFQALFPEKKLNIMQVHPNSGMSDSGLNLTGELSQVHLRLSQSVQISMPLKDKSQGFIGGEPQDTAVYRWSPNYGASGKTYGVPQSAQIPNVLKSGQLDWNLPALRNPVSLSGLKTVGDLVSRVVQVTHLELYADKRYEGKSLMILGNDHESVSASDLLRALAFCVTGAFRQVGPAYVLTDDVVGTEARRAILIQFNKEADWSVLRALSKASDIMGTKHSLKDLTAFDDPLALNSAEQKKVPSSDDLTPSWRSFTLPLSQLTEAQQDNVRQQATNLTQSAQNSPDGNNQIPDLNGNMKLQIHPSLELLVPSLNAPVKTSFAFFDLFNVSHKLEMEQYERKQSEAAASNASQSTPPAPSLSQMMALIPRRAILVQPASKSELISKIAAMKHLGFNELWLIAFAEGHRTTSLADGSDLLTQALRLTHGTGIRVYAVMDLFQWGTDAPTGAIDLNALGQTSAQSLAQTRQDAMAEADAYGNPTPQFDPVNGLSVTPLDSDVGDRLTAVVKSLAQRPGLAGLIWRKTAPVGYDNQSDSYYQGKQADLGFSLGARLMFLRQQHADPIDVGETRIMAEGVPGGLMGVNGINVSINETLNHSDGTNLPDFNNLAQDAQLSQAWDKVRRDADLRVMHALYTAAKSGNPHLELFVQQRHSDFSQDWYGIWDNPTAALPEWQVAGFGNWQNDDKIAKKQSHIALVDLGAKEAKTIGDLPSALMDQVKDATWDGFVWDITQLKPSALSALKQPVEAK